MSEEHVETARQLSDAWNHSDWGFMRDLFWPDAVAITPEGWPEAKDSQGWPAMQRTFERLKDSWADERFEVDSTGEVSEGVVLQYGHWRGAGKGSGIPLDLETWIVFRFRGEKAERVEYYLDREQAMRAAGL